MMSMKPVITLLCVGFSFGQVSYLPIWQEGMLDIHHINTGDGDNAFMVFPDGTTLLFDAGILQRGNDFKNAPLKVTAPVPNDSRTTEQRLESYIKAVAPKAFEEINYALISHFHIDHYGSFVALSKLIPFQKSIDRNFPDYNFPLDLKTHLAKDKIFNTYLDFTKTHTVEALKVGSASQIVLKYKPKNYDHFSVRNVKANATIWTGKETQTRTLFTAQQMTDYYKGGYNENPLSMAIMISYGNFKYFTGGDNTGLNDYGMPEWFDVETPMAKSVGKVSALALNHHGNYDATNWNFVKTLNPKVVVQQLWCSDHPGQQVYQRLIYKNDELEDRQIFSTNMHPETLVTYGPWFKNAYKSMQGHVVIRVMPDAKTYVVYILDESSLQLKETFGPYNINL